MTVLHSTEQFNEVYKMFSQHFKPNQTASLHNLLWQIIINNIRRDRDFVFTACYYSNELQLSLIENKTSGHYLTYVYFNDDVSYGLGCDIAEKISEQVFGSSPHRTTLIVINSMK